VAERRQLRQFPSLETADSLHFCRLKSPRLPEFIQSVFKKSTLVMNLSVHRLLLPVYRQLLMMTYKD